MRRGTSVLLAGLALSGVVACRPDPGRVYVNLAAVPAAPLVVDVRAPGLPLDRLAGSTARIGGLPSKEILVGPAEGLAEAALQQIREHQERTFLELLDRMTREYQSAVDRARPARMAEILAAHRQDTDETFEALLAVFDSYSGRIGPPVRRLAWLAGFPDPDPDSRREPPAELDIAAAYFRQATAARSEIADLDAGYRREIDRTLDELAQRLIARLRELATTEAAERDAAAFRAEQEARAIADQLELDLAPAVLDADRRLAPAPAAEASFEVPGSRVTLWPFRPEAHPDGLDRIRRQAEVFARLKGKILVARPQPGARNVTAEFLEWRRRQLPVR